MCSLAAVLALVLVLVLVLILVRDPANERRVATAIRGFHVKSVVEKGLRNRAAFTPVLCLRFPYYMQATQELTYSCWYNLSLARLPIAQFGNETRAMALFVGLLI